ncbi:hypothetical protein PVL29_013582 [Vitis rotundifolia]|uniref:Uncharacterized protein n=1 Tax=Vitis rotundifolia TaxID=103349 RepID=A0AA39DPI6_VITRO|nr:hypothetical protein PVL29_013582 [Vitis rotundifolia]
MAFSVKRVKKIRQIMCLRQVMQRQKTTSVSAGHRRFVIPTWLLNLLIFVALLDKAEEEFGLQIERRPGFCFPVEWVLFFYRSTQVFLEKNEKKYGGPKAILC